MTSSSSHSLSDFLLPSGIQDSTSFLLCLKCRQIGHIVNECPSSTWPNELMWFFSDARRQMTFEDRSGPTAHELCKRCRDLNVLEFLHHKVPWKSREGLNDVPLANSEHVRKLGVTGTIQYWDHCSLCRCLFALTPNPSSEDQSIYMIPVWSVTFVEGSDGIANHTDEDFVYANCLVVVVDPSKHNFTRSDQIHRGDGLCIHNEDDNGFGAAMGGRTIDLRHLNISILQTWISTCERLHHVDCSPLWTDDIRGIRLIDVNARQVVPYPNAPCDYIALSYVCGGVVQGTFQLGSKVARVPRTIEDAISLVKQLGKGYLWVDSICIDQTDSTDKVHQISKMSTIYRGAYATILVLTGTSADSGISRIGNNANTFPQLSCRIEGKRLVGIHPSLLQQTWTNPWGKRSWTLQEALLSPRCLYFSDHQVYFECNAMTCTEALDETHSWIHQLNRDLPGTRKRFFQGFTGGGALRNPVYEQTGKRDRLRHYGTRVRLYSMRSMTDPADAINAISGILQSLEAIYPRGFFWGLPVEELPWTLLWRFQLPSSRRLHFPTWSWAGWKGVLAPAYPSDLSKPHQFPIYLRAWKVAAGQFVELFESRTNSETNSVATQRIFENDPISKLEPRLYTSVLTSADFNVGAYPLAENFGYLFLSATLLTLTRLLKHTGTSINDTDDTTRASQIYLQNVACDIKFFDPGFEIKVTSSEPVHLLLLARDHNGKGYIHNHMLVVRFDERDKRLATRVTTAVLLIPDGQLGVLEEWRPERRELILA